MKNQSQRMIEENLGILESYNPVPKFPRIEKTVGKEME